MIFILGFKSYMIWKNKWCPLFNHSTFSADIKSTQISESTNRVFTEISCKTISIIEFVKYYQQRTTKMWDIKTTKHYKFWGKPKFFIRVLWNIKACC